MKNIEIREFQQSIVNFINQSKLPLEVKRISLTEILHQLEMETNTVLRMEMLEREKEDSEKQEGEKEE